MKTIFTQIKTAVITGLLSVAAASLVAGSASAEGLDKTNKHNHDLEHYTKVAVADSAKGTALAAKDTAKATGHAAAVTGRSTGRYFRRVGRAIF